MAEFYSYMTLYITSSVFSSGFSKPAIFSLLRKSFLFSRSHSSLLCTYCSLCWTLFSSLPYWLIPTCPSLNSRTPVLQSFPDLPQRIRYLSSDCLHCGHVVLCTSLLWFTGVLEPFMYISSQFRIQWYHTGILKLSFWLLESGAFNFSNAPLPITMVFFTFFFLFHDSIIKVKTT